MNQHTTSGQSDLGRTELDPIRATPAARREGSVMSASRTSRRLFVAAVTVVGIAGGALVTHADPFRTRALETGATQDLATTAAPTWPAVAPTCTLDTACDVTLTAGTGSVAVTDEIAGDTTVPFYGFGVNGAAPALAGADGSVIKVPLGTTIHLTLDNQLGQDLDLSFPSLGHVTRAGDVYTVVADKVGTMVFQPGANDLAPRQVAMGLVGVLVVTPTSGDPVADCATCAYDPAVAFDDEVIVATTDLDAEFAQDPMHFDMSYFGQTGDAQQHTRRVYHVINGRSFPDTDVIDVRAGDDVLLRYVNAGVTDKNMGLLGLRQQLLGRNASAYSSPQTLVAPLVGPGETADVAVSVPVEASAGQKYSLMDQGRHMDGGTAAGFGGALTFIDVWAGTSPTVDGLGFDLATGTLTATGHPSDATHTITGYQTLVTDSELLPLEADWVGLAVTIDPVPAAGADVAIDVTGIAATAGQHVWVRAQQDGTLWSAPTSVVALAAPTVSNLVFDGTTLSATAAATAPATVASFETGVTDTDAPPSTWTPGVGDPVAISTPLTAAHGQYVWVRATDSNGLQSSPARVLVPYSAPTVGALAYDGAMLTATGVADPLLTLTGFEYAVTDTDAAPDAWTAGDGDALNIAQAVVAVTGQHVWVRVTDSNATTSDPAFVIAGPVVP